jgi:hypothetical protein
MSEEILKELLSEVKAIKEASIPKPSPPPAEPKGWRTHYCFNGFLVTKS